MVEQDVIRKRLVVLEEYLRDLASVQELPWKEFSTDKITRRFVERTLHIAIEACLDIANHIISYEGYREPRSNKDCFEILMEQGILEVELTQRLKKMAQFRNVIVHDYIGVQPEIVYAVLTKHVKDIATFGQLMQERYVS